VLAEAIKKTKVVSLCLSLENNNIWNEGERALTEACEESKASVWIKW